MDVFLLNRVAVLCLGIISTIGEVSACKDMDSNFCGQIVQDNPGLCNQSCMHKVCRRSCGQCPSVNCYKCDMVTAPEQCNSTHSCPDGQFCIVVESLTASFEKIFQLGCSTSEFCAKVFGTTPVSLQDLLLGKKKSVSLLGRCCSRDFCNSRLSEQTSSAPLSTPTTSPAHTCQDVSTAACSAFLQQDASLCKDSCFRSQLCPRSCHTCPCSYKTKCPSNYITIVDAHNKTGCYSFATMGKTWNDSKNYCALTGDGQRCEGLVRIESGRENKAISDYIKHHLGDLQGDSSTVYWTDAFTNNTAIHDNVHEESLTWYWSSNGNQLQYFNFQHHAHNHGGPTHPQRFIAFGPEKGHDEDGYRWNGDHRSALYRPLCEYYLNEH